MQTALAAVVDAALPAELPDRIGVAVSGGSDSVALLLLMQDIGAKRNFAVEAATVNHGLRNEAAAEAAKVAALCADRRIPHETLRWQGWDGAGNTQNAARQARYGLLSEWAASRGLQSVALGHTLDDQAETVVMRLARGAGVEGLCAMSAVSFRGGLSWLRPLLEVRRTDLRSYLKAAGIGWSDDPSNEDAAYARVRVRHVLERLGEVDITPEKLAHVARNMQSADNALDRHMRHAARGIIESHAGALSINWTDLRQLPEETIRRMTLAALRWIAGEGYAPRARSLTAALSAVDETGSATVDGCRLLLRQDRLWILRELNAVKNLHTPPDALWDGRWMFSGGTPAAGSFLAAVGEAGIAQCPDWRATGLPRPVVLSTPALWRDDTILAAPCAGRSEGWRAEVKNTVAPFFESP